MEALLFTIFALSSIVFASGLLLIRDPVKAAMALIGCFFSIACLYLMQRAELLGVLQVIVYAGAIMVLFVFVIMLVENKEDDVVANDLPQRMAVPVKFLAVTVVSATIGFLIHRTAFKPTPALPDGFGSVSDIGRRFFGSLNSMSGFVFHFEFTSVLLLAGIVGAVILSKRRGGQS